MLAPNQLKKEALNAQVEEFFNKNHGKDGRFTAGKGGGSERKVAKLRDAINKEADDKMGKAQKNVDDIDSGNTQIPGLPEGNHFNKEDRRELAQTVRYYKDVKKRASDPKATADDLKTLHRYVKDGGWGDPRSDNFR